MRVCARVIPYPAWRHRMLTVEDVDGWGFAGAKWASFLLPCRYFVQSLGSQSTYCLRRSLQSRPPAARSTPDNPAGFFPVADRFIWLYSRISPNSNASNRSQGICLLFQVSGLGVCDIGISDIALVSYFVL